MFSEIAKNIIYNANSDLGFLASSVKKDNYNRVWSRDSMMTGYLGILLNDQKMLSGLETSILTLAKHQAENGQIPSNVSEDQVSYGSLVGRVDATTWFVVTTCEYLKHTKKTDLKNQLKPNIDKALACLKTWEYNNRGLIYTPLGGNWADEYITSGYTLYDNVLRFWALKNAAELYEDSMLLNESKKTKQLIEENFLKNNSEGKKYHPTAYQKATEKPYFWATLNANGYDERFDLSGNALAILNGFNINLDNLETFLTNLADEFKHWMLPVFYPIIFPKDADWKLLENNYNYDFKNQPYHFHNGGSWPIFLGWLCLALKKNNRTQVSEKIKLQYQNLLKLNHNFNEYYSTDTLEPLGTEQLCFSAVGYLLMNL